MNSYLNLKNMDYLYANTNIVLYFCRTVHVEDFPIYICNYISKRT